MKTCGLSTSSAWKLHTNALFNILNPTTSQNNAFCGFWFGEASAGWEGNAKLKSSTFFSARGGSGYPAPAGKIMLLLNGKKQCLSWAEASQQTFLAWSSRPTSGPQHQVGPKSSKRSDSGRTLMGWPEHRTPSTPAPFRSISDWSWD